MERLNDNRLRPANIIRRLGPLIGLIALFIIITAINSDFIRPTNLFNLLRQVSINAIIAFGMTFVILTGGIDLSVGSMLALSGVFMAKLMVSGMPPSLALILAVMVGLFLGAINGVSIAYGKVAPFIATLATMTIYRGLTLVLSEGNPITGLTDSMSFVMLGRGYIAGVPVPVIIMILVFAILWIILSKTPFGRKVYAIGGNEKVSEIVGIKIKKVKIMVYSLIGGLSALAGVILTSRLNSAQPTAGSGYELDAIAAVVLGGTSLVGGKGKITGTLIGALIIGTLNNGLNILGVSSFYQMVVKGIVILLAVLLDRGSDED